VITADTAHGAARVPLPRPSSTKSVRIDITDIYLFRVYVGAAVIMSVNSPAAATDTYAGFHAEAHYDFCIDVDWDAIEDLTCRVVFGRVDQDGRQPLELRLLEGTEARGHSAWGALPWDSTETVVPRSQGLRVVRAGCRVVFRRTERARRDPSSHLVRARGGPEGLTATQGGQCIRRHHRVRDRARGP
jgi:hypothetical protein